jgi:hypothetical protein
MCGVSFIDGHVDGENKGRRCENCVYYNTERTDQPCCSCVCGCNFESEVDSK